MSDLRPNGIKVEIGGQERNLLFTINVIDEIQASCNMPLFDAIGIIAGAAGGETDHETLTVYRFMLTALLNRVSDTPLTEKEVGEMVDWLHYGKIAAAMLEAYGISMPERDEDDLEDDAPEDKDPNRETGQ